MLFGLVVGFKLNQEAGIPLSGLPIFWFECDQLSERLVASEPGKVRRGARSFLN
jgi:hypothetical protein